MSSKLARLLRRSFKFSLYGYGFLLFSAQAQVPFHLGDIDADGRPTVYDLTQLVAYYNGDLELTEELQPFADLNGDGVTNLTDIQLLRDAVLKRIDLPFPDISPELTSESQSTSSPFFALSGFVLPGSEVLVEGGKNPLTVVPDGDGSFQVDVELYENQINKLFVTAFNSSGNASFPKSIEVTHDSVPPNLFIDFPMDGEELITETTDIAGRVGDVLSGYQGLDVTVNGEDAAVVVGIGQNGTFEKGSIPLELGRNVISVTASDILGNSVTRTKTLLRIDPEGPVIAAASGNAQEAMIHTALAEPVMAKVVYPNGSPVINKWVEFKVIRSDGLISTDPANFENAKQNLQLQTNELGEALAYWRMGADAGCGNNRLQVTSKDVAGTAYFCASANPQPPKQINIGSGNNQRISTSAKTIDPLNVWVSDSCNGVRDVPVIFTVLSGGGLVNGESDTVVFTSQTGHAEVEFDAGPTPGNNIIRATFDENDGPAAIFVIFGAASDPSIPTTFSGIIFDNSNLPLGGIRCQLEISGEFLPPVFSAEDGSFFIENVPAGPGHLHVDGQLATTLNGEPIPPGSYPSLHYQVVTIQNSNNSLGQAVLMPPLNPNNSVVFDNSTDLELTCEGMEGLRMFIKAGSMRLKDGTKPDWRNPAVVSLNQVHFDDIPMPMPDGVAPPFAWTLQPGGATFSTPVSIEYPNMSGLAPGSVAYFLSYDHDLEEFIIVSSGQVSDDGAIIRTDPGSGIVKAGWGGNCPPYEVTGEVCHLPGVFSAMGDWTCEKPGVISSMLSLSEYEQFLCKGQSATAPTIPTVVINPGVKKRTPVQAAVCPTSDTPDSDQTENVSYSEEIKWEPDLLTVDWSTKSAGKHTFTAKVKGKSSEPDVCPDTGFSLAGTFTVYLSDDDGSTSNPVSALNYLPIEDGTAHLTSQILGITVFHEPTPTIDVRCDPNNGEWVAYISMADQRIKQASRLFPELQNVTDSLVNGTTDCTELSRMAFSLDSVANGGGHDGYYMLSAVVAHENKHVSIYKDDIKPVFESYLNTVESLTVEIKDHQTKSAALAEILKMDAYKSALNDFMDGWATAEMKNSSWSRLRKPGHLKS